MIDTKYGNYNLFQYLIIAFILLPINVVHSWSVMMIYAAIILIIFGTLSTFFEHRHPVYKAGNHMTTVPWLRTILLVISTALFFLLTIQDIKVTFLIYYVLIATPQVISAYFTTCRRSQF